MPPGVIPGIPMRLPAAFPLPDELLDQLCEEPLERAVADVVKLALQAGCADVAWIAEPRPDLTCMASEGDAAAIEEAFPTARRQAMDARSPMLFMATGTAEGQPAGFHYVLPLIGDAGEPLGTLSLHRWLPSGPMNHDQPAIASALCELLVRRLAAGPQPS